MKALTRRQVRDIDRRAVEEYGMAGVVLMENAGRQVAEFIIDHLERPGRPPVAILCGGGNNGGDGFVIARHLANARFKVEVLCLAPPQRLPPDARANYEIVRQMNLPLHEYDREHAAQVIRRSQVVVDALLGTGFSGSLRAPLDEAITLMNRADHAMIVAVDVPSGLDCDSGRPADPTVRAAMTVTFVAPKVGFATAQAYTGQVLIADIGVPRALWD